MKTLGWKKHKLESRLLEEISITSDMQMTNKHINYGNTPQKQNEMLLHTYWNGCNQEEQ